MTNQVDFEVNSMDCHMPLVLVQRHFEVNMFERPFLNFTV